MNLRQKVGWMGGWVSGVDTPLDCYEYQSTYGAKNLIALQRFHLNESNALEPYDNLQY